MINFTHGIKRLRKQERERESCISPGKTAEKPKAI